MDSDFHDMHEGIPQLSGQPTARRQAAELIDGSENRTSPAKLPDGQDDS
jgi:hypothetical protein